MWRCTFSAPSERYANFSVHKYLLSIDPKGASVRRLGDIRDSPLRSHWGGWVAAGLRALEAEAGGDEAAGRWARPKPNPTPNIIPD
jgi:hypothetical protein